MEKFNLTIKHDDEFKDTAEVYLKITKANNPDLKSEVWESILRSLPLWFGLEYAIVNYIKEVKTMDTLVKAL